MTTIIERKYRVSRQINSSLWGSSKDPVHNRNYRPGQHGRTGMKKYSDFGKQGSAQRSFKTYYGIGGKQFTRLYHMARKKKGNTANNLIAILETRLSAVVYHAGLAPTIFSAKQLVSHKHVTVNGKIINIGSYNVSEGDVIEVRDRAKNIPFVTYALEAKDRAAPSYIHVDAEKRSAKLIRVPLFVDVPYPSIMEPHLVIQYYSK